MYTKQLLLINSRFLPLIGGGETYTLELIENFVQQGWEVHLATRSNTYRQNEWRGCRIHYVDGFDDDRLQPWRCIPDLRRILDKVKPDLVHVHNIMPFFIYASVVEKDEFPTVLTIHNTPVIPQRLFGTFNNYEAERLFVRQLLANGRLNKLIVGSRYYLDAYLEVAPWIKDALEAEVVYFFPPQLTQGSFTERQKSKGGGVRLIFPSRLIKRKGIENTIAALSRLPDSFTLLLPSFSANEQRDQYYKKHIKDLMEELGVQNRVEIPNEPVPPEKMHKYYQKADIAIMPSHYEGFGIAAVEAMSQGLPVVASEVGGLREIVVDEENGILIPPNDTSALVRAILRLADDGALYSKVTRSAIKTVQERFNRKTHMERIGEIYAEVLQR